jgi:hypothetical protein
VVELADEIVGNFRVGCSASWIFVVELSEILMDGDEGG